jgi:aspartate racemase
VKHFQVLLSDIVKDGDQPLANESILTESERQQLSVEWNDTATEYPYDRCIHELFEEQVERTPDAVALVFEDRQLTYRELNTRANRLANHLSKLSVKPETLVGICMNPSLERIAGILGILKAGGAYLPLDPAYPEERLALLLEDSEVSVLITEERIAPRLRGCLPDRLRGETSGDGRRAHVVCLDSCREDLDRESEQNPSSHKSSDNLAYVMYTSGTSGRPKGVSIVDRSVVRLVRNADYFNVNPAEVFIQSAPFTFDVSTFEIWGSLLNGARLVVFSSELPSSDDLANELSKRQVSTLWLIASLFRLMVDERIDALRGVRQLLAGGDVLSLSHTRTASRELKNCRLINGYGPTESATFACCHPISGGSQSGSDVVNLPGNSVPIGRPVSNTKVYLLDHDLQLVPCGVSGELYIGGDGLARGYLNDPELTADRFVPGAVDGSDGSRLYRTGDLARCRPDGNIEFLGRTDYQVKIRGFRIELEEIEAVLGRHPNVRDTALLAREDHSGNKRLVAYLTSDSRKPPTVDELRRFLGKKLPGYMIPSLFVIMDALPLTPNGKVDRGALPAPDTARPDLERDFAAPRTPTEKTLADIWAEILGLDRVGIHDNFFDLGGHSLLATQVISRVRETFRAEIPLRSLFESPTVSGFAIALVETEAEQVDDETLAQILSELEQTPEDEADKRLST